MTSPAKTLYVGLDACDLHLAQRFAAEGHMPHLAGLLAEGASVETLGPVGYFVAGNWPTIYTGTTPSRHQFLCAGQVSGGTYAPRWVGPVGDPPPVWERLSAAGMRVASIDAPHARVATELNGIQLTEWGCHDRHGGAASFPSALLDEVNGTYGPHPLGMFELDHDPPHFAPCDAAHRKGRHRTETEDAALYADLAEGQRRKHRLSLDLLDRGRWDLYFTVLGETHCVGHQFWSTHDPTHPWHAPSRLEALGGDPVRAMYSAIDATLGAHLERVSPDTTVYVHSDHGMQPHYDGAFLLDPVLWRLEQYVMRGRADGWMSRVADVAVGPIPGRLRSRALASATELRRRYATKVPFGTFDDEIPWMGRRRWWANPNDTASGSIRLNVEGREPSGRIRADRVRSVGNWLTERLHELINVDTGAPAVTAVLFTDDNYERVPGDAFGDLIVEWDRSAPIETVWSPATGVVRVPYEGNRSGDHHRVGLLLARGPGIVPGRRTGTMMSLDVAPTIAASLGYDLPDVDGLARADFVPAPKRPFVSAVTRPALGDTAPVAIPIGSARQWQRENEIPSNLWTENYAFQLAAAHHHTSVAAHAANEAARETRARLDVLTSRIDDLDHLASIAPVTAWLRQIDVPESLLVSVVMPTRNRREKLTRAIESVRAQSYPRWELLVVDDGSTDDTWEFLEQQSAADERIRAFRFDEHKLSSPARNHALDHAKGDAIVYLDDDNRFDADWLRSVVWAFTEYPEHDVCYGARVVDDDDRHRRLPSRSLPFVQFLRWDREAELRANRVDQNVIAHRPSLARFDEELTDFMDWDHLLQLTDGTDPLPLPVLAAYYYTDEPDRMTSRFRYEDDAYRYVQEKTIARRRGRE